jgi:hypothetical protein
MEASTEKGRPSRGGTITGPLDPVTRQPVTATFGATVAFEVETSATAYPWLEVQAHDLVTGQLIYSALKGGFPTYFDPGLEFMLGPTGLWQGGAAEGSATLFESIRGTRRRVLAESVFPVAA